MAAKGVCLYFSVWIIWKVKNHVEDKQHGEYSINVSEGIIDTCPGAEIIPSNRVVKMCQTKTAVEETEDGNDYLDSIFLSLTVNENNCSCYLYVKNFTISPSLYIKQYNNERQQASCGMEMDIYQHRPREVIPLIDPIPTRCNGSGQSNYFSLVKDEYLQFRSRIVDGIFSKGYCIQIIRVHSETDRSFLEISCGDQEFTTSKAAYTTTNPRTTLNDITMSGQFTSMLPSSTSMTNNLYRDTDSEGDSTLYIGVGAGGGFILCVALLVVIFVCKRRNLNPSTKEETSAYGKASTATDVDDDDDGLKYNVLYVSSEQNDNIDVNYSTADEATPSHAIGDDEGGYSTVDHNKKNQILNLRAYQDTDAASEINAQNSVKHINSPTESGCVYAVVDKTKKTNNSVKNVETGATYAVVNKNRLRHSNEGNE